ncbi:g10489 [Coccomyxa elongata]
MGCKPRVAHKASKSLFEGMAVKLKAAAPHPASETVKTAAHTIKDSGWSQSRAGDKPHNSAGFISTHALQELNLEGRIGVLPGRKATVSLLREEWERLVMEQIREYTDKLLAVEDFSLACSIREQKRSVTVLLAGTSGTGKSTLAGLLAARLGISTIISTDSVRNMMRSFTPQEANPLLWASTYEAGQHVADLEEALPARSAPLDLPGKASTPPPRSCSLSQAMKQRTIQGYKAQSEMVLENLDKLIGAYEGRKESLVVEGVHLSLNSVVRLMQRHPSILPFLIHISNEAKHRERFAVRAKYMALEPSKNRYVKYMRAIRTIQEYLVARAQRHAVPSVNNTNVDRSVATIHATVIGCLRRQARGENLLDVATKTTRVVAAEYAQYTEATWSSKGMLEVIRRKMSAAALDSPDKPSTSTSSPLGPLSEIEERREADVDAHSIYDVADSELMSSDGAEQVGGSSDDGEDSDMGEPQMEEGSVADSDAEEHEFEETPCHADH